MGQEVGRLLCCGPGTASQRCNPMSDSQIRSLNKSGVQPSRESQSHQGHLESGLCPKAHHLRHTNQLAPSVAFLHLAIDQTCLYLPSTHISPSTSLFTPFPKMSCQCIEVHV